MPPSVSCEQAGFEHRLGQLLDEQRHALGPLQDRLGHDSAGSARPPVTASTNAAASPPAEAVEGEERDVREGRPGRRQLGAEGRDEQHRQALEPVDGEVEQLARGRVDPVQVLEDHQDRLVPGQALELVDQDLEGPLLALLRRQIRAG